MSVLVFDNYQTCSVPSKFQKVYIFNNHNICTNCAIYNFIVDSENDSLCCWCTYSIIFPVIGSDLVAVTVAGSPHSMYFCIQKLRKLCSYKRLQGAKGTIWVTEAEM